MNALVLIIVLLGLSAIAYRYGRRKALSSVHGNVGDLHSLPSYHGAYVVLWCGLPALIIVSIWLMGQTNLIERIVLAGLSDSIADMNKGQISLLLSDIRNLATGDITSRNRARQSSPPPNVMATCSA